MNSQQQNFNYSGALNAMPSIPQSASMVSMPQCVSLSSTSAIHPSAASAYGTDTPSTSDKLTSETMLEYLRNQDDLDCMVSIYHAKVAQKSYGNEKRFFCPPPCIYLKGSKGWHLRKSRLDALFRKTTNGSSGMDPNASSSFNGQSNSLDLCCYIGISSPIEPPIQQQEKLMTEQEKVLVEFNGKDFCSVRTLYISDSDKRKYFTLDTNFFYNFIPTGTPCDLGNFASQRIKVISKPSKKKQSMKSTDCKYLCIAGGTKVALFNRLRSQTVSTRFLHVENEKFNASSNKWGAFTIYLVDEEDEETSPTSENYCVKDGYVNYGSIVRLVDSATGWALPNLRICKVEKNEVLLNIENEPVSQLHKCALQMLDQDSVYLCLNNDKIQLIEAKRNNNATHTICDGAAWTIISTDTTEYRFYEALGPVQTQVTPVPMITGLNMEASESHLAYIEISGYNFLASLTVWLGSEPIETYVRSTELIRCPLPPLSKLNCEWPSGRTAEDKVEFPLSLVRHDGVIYATSLSVKYSLPNSNTGKPGGIPLKTEFEQL
ncbi:beta-trefoil DNA-binding domain-containing protein [Ditylenchus destructor]|uniref:Beta-trefoil DNA-binding domain-containing protein n=1 Tax=Ditylenchus destructor TaxID=166010 RepID=A0AAD4MW84_9BILA|nr:beta-trefoil DNA-binding domain-containing protein [Ditylenchus destructor]